MTVYLLRHAKAGDRSSWEGDDRLRPLSPAGQRQAVELVTLYTDQQFDRIVSSHYVRCMETVVPLAGGRGIAIEPHDALAEGATLEVGLAIVRKYAAAGAVLCSHGDVIPMLLEHYASLGLDLGPHPRCAKASTWALSTDPGGEVWAASYLPPPTGETPHPIHPIRSDG